MKTLYIIRHAKSSWDFDLEDHKRPLNDRGLQDAKLIGKKLKSIVKSVDKIVSSDAQRAKATAAIVMENMEFQKPELVLEPRLYDFYGDQIMEVIKATSDDIHSLMIFGHNHALTHISNSLGNKNIDNLPTAGVMVISFDTNRWNTINKGKTLQFICPKELR